MATPRPQVPKAFLVLGLLILAGAAALQSEPEKGIAVITQDWTFGLDLDVPIPRAEFKEDAQKDPSNYAGDYASVEEKIEDEGFNQVLHIKVDNGKVTALFGQKSWNDSPALEISMTGMTGVSLRGSRFQGLSPKPVQGRFVVLKVKKRQIKGLLEDEHNLFWVKQDPSLKPTDH